MDALITIIGLGPIVILIIPFIVQDVLAAPKGWS